LHDVALTATNLLASHARGELCEIVFAALASLQLFGCATSSPSA